MKRICLYLLLIFLASCNQKKSPTTDVERTTGSKEIDFKNTYAVFVGVLEWQDPGLGSFSNVHRKDEELFRLFQEKGVPKENMIFLKDREATKNKIESALDDMLKKTTPGSGFLFYYAGHGTKDEQSNICFANYDMLTANTSSTGFSTSSLSSKINMHFKGNRVWLMADCCYSGGLLNEAEKISKNGKEVIAFTSATAANTSTGNWTFSQTMIDCISGTPICDRNADGKITLAEARDELYDAMLYREHQLSGTVFYTIDENTVLATCTPMAKDKRGDYAIGQYVNGFNKEQWETARIIGVSDKENEYEFYHYSDKLSEKLPDDKIMPISFITYSKGDKIQVEWEGQLWPAEITEVKDQFHYIHYDGYGDYWNEWVTYDRIRTGKEKKVKVEWKGQWYPALVMEEKDGKHFVHYEGFDYTWDEWVKNERIRY